MASVLLSDDVNILIYNYLIDSGFVHSAFVFSNECQIFNKKNSYNSQRSVGLIELLQKGICYSQAEICAFQLRDKPLSTILEKFDPASALMELCSSFKNFPKTSNFDDDKIDLKYQSECKLFSYPLEYKDDIECSIFCWSFNDDFVCIGYNKGDLLFFNPENEEYSIVQNSKSSSDINEVISLFITLDSKYYVSGDICGNFKVFLKTDNRLLYSNKLHNGAILGIKQTLSPNVVISYGIDSTINFVQLIPFSILNSYKNHFGPVIDVDFTSDESMLVSCSNDSSVCIQSVKTNFDKRYLNPNKGDLYLVRCSLDSKLLAVASCDHSICIYDGKNTSILFDISKHCADIIFMKWLFSSDNILLSGSFDGTLLYHIIIENEYKTYCLCNSSPMNHMDVYQKSNYFYIATGLLDGNITIIAVSLNNDNDKLKIIKTLNRKLPFEITYLQWSKNGNKVCCAMSNGQLFFIDLSAINFII